VLVPQREENVPTYQYACTDCGDRTEVVQKFTDDSLSVCTTCGGKLRKVFSPVGIVFKGSGFYRTDSRKSPVVPADGASKDGGSKDGAAKDGAAKDGSRNGSESKSGNGSSGGESSGGKTGSDSGSSGGEKKSSQAAPASSGSSSSSSGSKVA
jgi:putative FmdB family regulatory protein